MSNEIVKEFCVKLTSFKLIGWLILLMGTLYLITNYSPSTDLYSSITFFIIISVIGLFFLYFGNKKRCLLILKDKIIYKEAQEKFNETFDKIILIKSFQELNKSTTNLIIMTEDNTLSISSAFFKEDLLIDAFKTLKSMNLLDIKFEDDLNWLNQ